MRRSRGRWLRTTIPALPLALAVLMPCAPLAHAAGPKIIGTVTFVGRPGLESIGIVSFAWTAHVPPPLGGSGGGAGKPTFDPFRIVALVDATSPALLDLTLRGTLLHDVHIDVNVRRGTIASYDLSNVTITANTRRVPDGGGPPLEELELTTSAVRETVTSPGGTVTTCFDLATSKSCD